MTFIGEESWGVWGGGGGGCTHLYRVRGQQTSRTQAFPAERCTFTIPMALTQLPFGPGPWHFGEHAYN